MLSLRRIIPRRARKIIRKKYRQATWRNRTLPDFIIVGAQKAGTSSLYYYLSQHPQIRPSYRKEVHFFDGGLTPEVDTYEQGQAWYRSHFPLTKDVTPQQKTFEASPLYLFNPLVPQRISALLPHVKLIVILRNPVERAISHYFHERRKEREPLSIMDALRAEEERLQPVLDAKDYKSTRFIHQSYKQRGLYHEQLQNYLRYFSMQDMLILNSEKFFADPGTTLRDIFKFIGVDATYAIEDLKTHNSGKNKTAITPDIREYLEAYYRPHNRALYQLTGENYGW